MAKKTNLDSPLVSIIILNWNGKEHLKKSLTSVSKLNYVNSEIIVVDNNSSDGSILYITKNYKKVRVIANKENVGFAEGNNIGFRASMGKYIVFLNNDTEVTSDFLHPLISRLKNDSNIGCIQPQMRTMENKNIMDSAGSYLTPFGLLYHVGYRQPYQHYNKSLSLFSAKGACMMFPRTVLNKTGVFDKDFFIFFEESDLCMRVLLSGYSVKYEPESVIYHMAGGDTGSTFNYPRRVYLSIKNINSSYIKNFGAYNMICIYIPYIFVQIGTFVYFLLKLRFSVCREMVRAWLWNVVNIQSTLRKRRIIQNNRKVSDKQLNDFCIYSPPISYYYYLLTGNLNKYPYKNDRF